MHEFHKLLTKEQVFTIPNFMSFFRLVLIPFIIWDYLQGEYGIAAALVAVSAATDILDGVIARRYNMVSDLGKVLDPFCDKLTHAALMICLLTRYAHMWLVFGLLVVKELTMFILGGVAVKRRGQVHSAKWYGKLCTVILEGSMLVLILFPELPAGLAELLMLLCCFVMVFSLIMYVIFWVNVINGKIKE